MAASLPLTAPILLLLIFLVVTVNVQTAECLSNATRVADLLPDDDEEFSMESEATRRILQSGGVPKTPYAQYKLRPYCDQATYGSCIGRDSKIYKRPCEYYNNCVRAAGS